MLIRRLRGTVAARSLQDVTLLAIYATLATYIPTVVQAA
jgi:hypothetical protein